MEPTVDTEDDVTTKLVATFVVDGRFYGLTTSRVREVVRVNEITPVHHSPEFILGIMNLRGRIVTIVDLRRKLFLNSIEMSSHTRIFIAEWCQEQVGLLVDKVGEVVPFDETDLLPVPENLPPSQACMLHGVFHSGQILIGLLNIDAILDDTHLDDRTQQNEGTQT